MCLAANMLSRVIEEPVMTSETNPPAASDPNTPTLDVKIVWRSDEASAPSEIREAINSLVEVLNRHGLSEHVSLQDDCWADCGDFKLL